MPSRAADARGRWWFRDPVDPRPGPRGSVSRPSWSSRRWRGSRVLVAYSLLVPLFRAPDELQHVDLVIASRTNPGYGDYDTPSSTPGWPPAAALLGRPALGSTGQSGDATVRSERPTLAELGPAGPAGPEPADPAPPAVLRVAGSGLHLRDHHDPGRADLVVRPARLPAPAPQRGPGGRAPGHRLPNRSAPPDLDAVVAARRACS